jgi:hypothetical protein
MFKLTQAFKVCIVRSINIRLNQFSSIYKPNAGEVKKLREITGSPLMDCMKALTESAGDVEKSKEYLRKKGLAYAEKRADRLAT